MVEILCTLIGVLSGIAIVASLMQQQSARNRSESDEQVQSPDETESLKGLTTQLQLLTHRVAADVSAHTQRVVHINERLLPAQNAPERILTAITELIHANESMQGQLEAAQDRLSVQSEQIESTARQARTDALTGLANRRALEESLKNCIDSIAQTNTTGLLLVDIDHFKSFNDNYGHITGDAVLASFARNISTWCNGKHYSARYGGEEFAVILTADSSSALSQLAAEARAFISQQVICHEDLRLTVTASAGLTTIQVGDSIKRVYERADEGLYRSKKAGRNCGHWLYSGEWKPFPSTNGSELKPNENASLEAAKIPAQKHLDETKEHLATSVVTSHPRVENTQVVVDDSGILDLSVFVDRLESQLMQLGRADMPATAIMLEAVGLTPESDNFDRAWADVLEIVQSNLRGIDLICRLRQNTLCVFLPGCTLNATLERAGGMQHMLKERQANSATKHTPERFAIAIASAQRNEAAGVFLQRLEDALDEAQDAAPLELVVCEATSSYFHAT